MPRLTVLLLALSLAACGTPTPYQPAEGGLGYVERPVEPARYRVTFSGNDSTPRETVESYALFRAAELTVAEGKDHFLVVARSTDVDTRYVQTYDNMPGDPFYRPWYPSMYPYGPPYSRRIWHYSPLYDGGGAVTTQTISRYRTNLEIVLRSGPAPSSDANAYDARQVMNRVGPLVVRTTAER